MNPLRLAAMLTAAALVSTAAMAQGGPNTEGPGAGAPGMQGPGIGGPGKGWGGWRWNSDTVAGWQLMTPEERTEHQNKMRSMKTYDECKAYHEEHRKLMERRAKDKGVTLMTPRRNPCDMMRARGIVQ